MSYRFASRLDAFTMACAEPDTLCRADAAIVFGYSLANFHTLQDCPLPAMYSLGLKYIRERRGETWKDAHATFKDGFGNCKDFVAWRLAELWLEGHQAEPYVYVYQEANEDLYHVVIRYPNGYLEDPSKVLGMR